DLVLFLDDGLVFRIKPKLESRTAEISLEQKQRFIGRGWRRDSDNRIVAARSANLSQSRIDRENRFFPGDRRLNAVTPVRQRTDDSFAGRKLVKAQTSLITQPASVHFNVASRY